MDDADIAQAQREREERALEKAIQAARGCVNYTADCCEECGCEIPSERQIAVPGTLYCFDCATELEMKAALRG